MACELVDTELKALAFKTVFVPLHIELDPETWEGVTRKYWQRDTYYLPISVYLPSWDLKKEQQSDDSSAFEANQMLYVCKCEWIKHRD